MNKDWIMVNEQVCKKCERQHQCYKKRIERTVQVGSTATVLTHYNPFNSTYSPPPLDTRSLTRLLVAHVVPEHCQYFFEHQVTEDLAKKGVMESGMIFE